MLVYVKGVLNDIRTQGENTFSYLYDNSAEPTLYRIKGKVEAEIGKQVTVLCRVTTFKDKLYLNLEVSK